MVLVQGEKNMKSTESELTNRTSNFFVLSPTARCTHFLSISMGVHVFSVYYSEPLLINARSPIMSEKLRIGLRHDIYTLITPNIPSTKHPDWPKLQRFRPQWLYPSAGAARHVAKFGV